jgi:hypothetical protein
MLNSRIKIALLVYLGTWIQKALHYCGLSNLMIDLFVCQNSVGATDYAANPWTVYIQVSKQTSLILSPAWHISATFVMLYLRIPLSKICSYMKTRKQLILISCRNNMTSVQTVLPATGLTIWVAFISGSVVVKALWYKPEGPGFETQWGEWIATIY